MYTKPKKSLGQNFLFDKNIQKKIIKVCAFKSTDTILEIGAGSGELTGLLAQDANCVYALEIDSGLCRVLERNLSGHNNVRIINKDILKFNLSECGSTFENKMKVIGNIPYYISTPIIEHLFKFRDIIEAVFITIQKEFAKRVAAIPGTKDYGALSCFVQHYSDPKILFTIRKGSFFPAPKVDSCFIKLYLRSKPKCEIKDEKLFFRVIRAAFNQRRKTLKNSLSGIIPEQELNLFFNKYDINPKIRPEELSLSDFAKLINI